MPSGLRDTSQCLALTIYPWEQWTWVLLRVKMVPETLPAMKLMFNICEWKETRGQIPIWMFYDLWHSSIHSPPIPHSFTRINPPIHQSVHLPAYPIDTHPSTHPLTHPCIKPSTYSSIHPPTHPSTHPFIYTPIHPPYSSTPTHPSTHQCTHPSITHLSTHSPINSIVYIWQNPILDIR